MSKTRKFILLTALYIAQGLPYGFFEQALPVLLRKAGTSLPFISLSSLLTIPWAAKFMWAPAVDRWHFWQLGLRRSWLLPLQLAAVVTFFSLAFVSPETDLSLILLAFLATNLLAASQDIATDGLAVDILDHKERGWGNGIQVAGYRLGMIIGGGALLVVYELFRWPGMMVAMALVTLLCTLPVAFYEEPSRNVLPPVEMKTVLKEVLHFFVGHKGAPMWVIVLLVYKTGHSAATSMIRPWLVDKGYSLTDIAWILGTAGFFAGFVGAVIGGWLNARTKNRTKLLIALGGLQVVAVFSYLLPVAIHASTAVIAFAAAFDHFTSGLATVTLFTLMMDACSKERAASDYTIQACLIVIATGVAKALGGFSAEFLGYQTHFALSAAIAAVSIALTWYLVSRAPVRDLLSGGRAA